VADPNLALFYDFARNKSLVASQGLGPTLTIFRASGGRYRDASGLMVGGLVANAPRFDHDPATGKCLGLLVEEQRFNNCRQSGNLFSAPWTSIQTPGIVANSAISPEGDLNVTLLSDNNATNREGVQQSITVPNDNGWHAGSIFVKKTTGGTSPTFGFELSFFGGTVPQPIAPRLNTDTGETNGVGHDTFQAEDYGEYWRIWCRAQNNSTGNIGIQFKVLPATAAHGSFIDVMSTTGSSHSWGAQLEIGFSTPTTYIPTTSIAMQRVAENIFTTDMSWINTTQGALVTEIRIPKVSKTSPTTPFIIAIDNGLTTSRILHNLKQQPDEWDTHLFVNATQLNDDGVNTQKGEILIQATSWDNATTTFSTSSNGRPIITNTSRSTPQGLTTLRLSSNTNAGHINGHMRSIRYYNVRKDDQFLKNLSNGLISETALSFSRSLARPLARNITRTSRG